MILVTGGAGYVGSVLTRELINIGESVRIVDLLWFENPPDSNPHLEFVNGDVRSWQSSWLDDVTAVVHLAGFSNDPTADFAPEANIEFNVVASRTLAKAVADRARRDRRIIRLLFGSTCSVYHKDAGITGAVPEEMTEDHPVGPTANYSRSKRLAEIEILRVASEVPELCPIILRKGTLFGLSPRMRFDLVLNAFCLSAWRSRLLTVHGLGNAWRPLVHVHDAADAYLSLLRAPPDAVRCQIFNIVHKNCQILELAMWVSKVLEVERGVSLQIVCAPFQERRMRSYSVDGAKLSKAAGITLSRGMQDAILDIWDSLDRGLFGLEPDDNPLFFNVKQLGHVFPQSFNSIEAR
jgi:nucleoside-diphosphate-sugar epimerase